MHMVVVRLLCMNLMIVVYFVGVVNFVTMLYGRFWKLLQNKLRMKNSPPNQDSLLRWQLTSFVIARLSLLPVQNTETVDQALLQLLFLCVLYFLKLCSQSCSCHVIKMSFTFRQQAATICANFNSMLFIEKSNLRWVWKCVGGMKTKR